MCRSSFEKCVKIFISAEKDVLHSTHPLACKANMIQEQKAFISAFWSDISYLCSRHTGEGCCYSFKNSANVYNIWWLNSGPIVVSVNIMAGYRGTEPHHSADNSCSTFPET